MSPRAKEARKSKQREVTKGEEGHQRKGSTIKKMKTRSETKEKEIKARK